MEASSALFRLEPPPSAEQASLDPLDIVRSNGLLHLFETIAQGKDGAGDATFRPYLSHLPGETDFEKVKPRVKKPKIFGNHLELIKPTIKYRPVEPLDQDLLAKAFTFTELLEEAKSRPKKRIKSEQPLERPKGRKKKPAATKKRVTKRKKVK